MTILFLLATHLTIMAQSNNEFGYPIAPDLSSSINAPVGKIADEISVSQLGAASYTMGVEIPTGVSNNEPSIDRSSTLYALLRTSDIGIPKAAPAGETCLKDAAAGKPVADRSSLTSCQPLSASNKLMYPGRPDNTSKGKSPLVTNTRAGF